MTATTATRLRAGATVRLSAVDDTTGVTHNGVEVTARAVDKLGCGCQRVTALRPGPTTGEHPDLVQAVTGCGAHPAELDATGAR